MIFAQAPPVTAGEIGTWLLCLFVVIQGASAIKTLLTKPKNGVYQKDRYKEEFVSREELNGKLDKIEKSQNNLSQQMTDMAKDVAVLKAKVKPYWET